MQKLKIVAVLGEGCSVRKLTWLLRRKFGGVRLGSDRDSDQGWSKDCGIKEFGLQMRK